MALEMSHGPVMVATTTKVMPGLQFEKSYCASLAGSLKIIQGLLGLVGFLCATAAGPCDYSRWYFLVCLTSFWMALITLQMYTFHVVEMLHYLPWISAELVFSACWTLMYLVAAGLYTTPDPSGEPQPARAAAGVVAFLGMSVHAWEAAFKLRMRVTGRIAQGTRTMATSNDRPGKF